MISRQRDDSITERMKQERRARQTTDQPPTPPQPEPLHVWIVYTEYQNGDPCIDGVFLSQAGAQAEADAVVKSFLWPDKSDRPDAFRKQVLGHELCLACMKRIQAPDGEESCTCEEGNEQHEDEGDWDVDVQIAEYEVKP